MLRAIALQVAASFRGKRNNDNRSMDIQAMGLDPQVVMQISWRNIVAFFLFSGSGVFMMVFARKIATGNNNILRLMHRIQRRGESNPSPLDSIEMWLVFGLGLMVALWGITLLFV
jgi:hypothetical protein